MNDITKFASRCLPKSLNQKLLTVLWQDVVALACGILTVAGQQLVEPFYQDKAIHLQGKNMFDSNSICVVASCFFDTL